jgi:3-deoxy-D-manno-octulosonic-acid transferase
LGVFLKKHSILGSNLYKLFISLYSLGIKITSLWNGKARQWVAGRKNIFETISSTYKKTDAQSVWMHCASLGEFEQGKPVLEEVKMKK